MSHKCSPSTRARAERSVSLSERSVKEGLDCFYLIGRRTVFNSDENQSTTGAEMGFERKQPLGGRARDGEKEGGF